MEMPVSSGCAAQYSSRISSSPCARSSANTGMRQRPRRVTILSIMLVNRDSQSSLFSWMCVPYVLSTIRTSGRMEGISADMRCRSSSRLKSPV